MRILNDSINSWPIRILFVIAVLTGVNVILLVIHSQELCKNTDVTEQKSLSSSATVSLPFKYVTRDKWLAIPNTNKLVDQTLPVDNVIICHTATKACNNRETCIFRVRYLQMFHMEVNNSSDIEYNFLIGGDGTVYEGTGWMKQGAHLVGPNHKSIEIAFIGTFSDDLPTGTQLNVTKDFLAEGIQNGYLTQNFKLFGQNQVKLTESPGKMLFNEIKTWPHWSSNFE